MTEALKFFLAIKRKKIAISRPGRLCLVFGLDVRTLTIVD